VGHRCHPLLDDPAPSDVVAAGSASASPQASAAEPAASAQSSAAAGADEPSAVPSGETEVAENNTKECTDAAIEVTAEADARRCQVGAAPRLTMTIKNVGILACLRDVGTKANELEITWVASTLGPATTAPRTAGRRWSPGSPGTWSPPASPGTAA
jgi:hypothetical protein